MRRETRGTPSSRLSWMVFGLVFGTLAGTGTQAADRFPFAIPGLDAEPSAIDLSTLGERPAGSSGPVRVESGHFVDGRGRRLRLLGVNFSFGANFPEHADAERIAAHLAKLGVNAVRHHHMDARDIWQVNPDGTRRVDPEKLDRLGYLIAQLKKHGIYSNINLHVSRSVTEAEGFPDARELPTYNKYVLYFDERLQGLLKDYARTLLGYENPHTGVRLAEESAVVTVEITNENRFAASGLGPLGSLPERYQDLFRERWNRWLQAKYRTTDALRRAWGAASEPIGDDIAGFGDFSEGAGPWALSVRGENRASLASGQPGPRADLPSLHVAIERADGVIHQLELARRGLSLERGRLYTVSFWIKAERPRSVYVDVSRDGDPWNSVGLGESVEATPRWSEVVRPFRATETLKDEARWIFKLGDDDGDLWIAAPRLRRGGEIVALRDDTSLESGTVPVPRRSLQPAVAEDIGAFMEDTEKAFFMEMARFLKEDLGVRAPVTGSQVAWQSLAAFEPLDFLDSHAYWEHPRFPRRSWDARDWNIPNQPMVRSPGSDALTRLAWYRAWGRPYTVSEYNHPAPNDYQVECVPLLCAVAALQDWDGVYIYSYQHGSGSWDADRIQRFFDINGNPAKLALLATGAMLFRRGDLSPAQGRFEPVAEAEVHRGLALRHRVGTELTAESFVRGIPSSRERRFSSDHGELRWIADDPNRARCLVDSSRTKLALGFIADDTVRLSGIEIQTGAVSRGFGVVAVSSLDGAPLGRSESMLVTTLANAENQGMEWNEDRTSVGDRWGSGPPLVEIVPAEVSIRLEERAASDGWRVYPLDARGLRRDSRKPELRAGCLIAKLSPADEAVWYEIVRELRSE